MDGNQLNLKRVINILRISFVSCKKFEIGN